MLEVWRNRAIVFCSTPYGISGFGTRAHMNPGNGTESAQRLTASVVSAATKVVQRPAAVACSTPYGISGLGRHLAASAIVCRHRAQRLTASVVSAATIPPPPDRSPPVLNALRHQWSRQALTSAEPVTPHVSAQRLTASVVSADRNNFFAVVNGGVLNALRHQWSRQIRFDTRVLNS
jgi:hypothetical protein